MPPSKRGKLLDGAALPDPGGDHISALPDDALHHVLSFLPAEDAVRTCVLARRWRHLWKSATGLRIGFSHGDTAPSVDSLRHFVNHLLLLRKRDSCLHTCDLRLRSSLAIWLEEERINVNLWIRHVVDHEVRMLRLEIQGAGFRFDMPLVSQHLTRLALCGVFFTNSHYNFSTCPNLKHLEFADSEFDWVLEISSKSVKYLSFNNGCNFDVESHTRICTPSLVSLRLDTHFCSLPLLDSMPLLKEAFLRDLVKTCDDCNDNNDTTVANNKCILLQGLLEAEKLTLMSNYNWAYFRSDLKWCPTFNNLRTLVLNEWCVDCDFYGLNWFLKHSPVLEKLTLYLFTKGPQHKLEMIGGYNQMEREATISKHLKEIRVKCEVVNDKVYDVLKFLGTFGITFLFK